jgi:hypothetical protein
MIRRRVSLTLFALLCFALNVGVVRAGIITIDLDPGMAGIQTTRTVTAGSLFSISVVFVGDGTTVFDGFSVDLNFNDVGPILSSGPLLAGSIVGTVPAGNALDVASFAALSVGDPLGLLGSIPDGPYTSSVDGAVFDPVEAFGPLFGAGVSTELVTLSFTGLSAGVSTIALDELFTEVTDSVSGIPIVSTYGAGPFTVTVMDSMNTIPEPSSVAVWGIGLALFAAGMRRREMSALVG